MYMKKNVGSKQLIETDGNTVKWQCDTCNGVGTARVNNWNSPRGRTCCGGRFVRNRDRLLIVWTDMRARCLDYNHPAYSRYNGFGAPEWDSYEQFSEWAMDNGWCYGLEIDRKDNLQGYSPSNCHFVTRTRNARNRSNNRILTAFGESKSATEWAEDSRCSVQAQSILARVDRYGWEVEKAIVWPARGSAE